MPVAENFLTPEVRKCPFPMYRLMRESEPVSYIPELDMVFVASYDLVLEVVRNPTVFSSKGPKGAGGARTKINFCPKANEIVNNQGFGRAVPTLVNNDPPSHGEFRKLVQQSFRVSRIRQMGEYVQQIVDELLDRIGDRDEFDINTELAITLPMYVIADQIGVERDDFEKFKLWSEAFIIHYRPPKPERELIEAAVLVVEAQRYLAVRMAQRRADPKDDMISELVNATLKDGRPLTDHEVMSVLEQLLVAGNDTTTNGIGNGILYLAKHPEVRQRLIDNPDLVPNFVEEILRMELPVQGLVRTTTQETQLGGVKLREGQTLILGYASASRDDSKFADGDTFDLDRPNSGAHLAFGSGIHHCVGSELARVEMRIAFASFLRKFPNFELAVDEDDLEYSPVFANRSLMSLPIRVIRD